LGITDRTFDHDWIEEFFVMVDSRGTDARVEEAKLNGGYAVF
jgi:hypothetical protein